MERENTENSCHPGGTDVVQQVLVVLQNAWAYQPEVVARTGEWPYERWIWALRWSRTGQRLSRIFDTDEKWESAHFCNTTKAVGSTSGSKMPPDLVYVREVIDRIRPRIILGCGKQAEDVLTKVWGGNLLCIPHPTCRYVTNGLLFSAKAVVEDDRWQGRQKLVQGRGVIEKAEVPYVGVAATCSPIAREGATEV